MKKLLSLLIIALAFGFGAKAQEQKEETSSAVKQFMQINTVESVVAGGMGRSKMIITFPDGTQKEADLDNLFSMTGINFKNIKDNEGRILRTIRSYTDYGWKLDHVTSLTLSQNDSGSGGIFMTRYLLSKSSEKKGF